MPRLRPQEFTSNIAPTIWIKPVYNALLVIGPGNLPAPDHTRKVLAVIQLIAKCSPRLYVLRTGKHFLKRGGWWRRPVSPPTLHSTACTFIAEVQQSSRDWPPWTLLLSQLQFCEITGNVRHVSVVVICLGSDHTDPGGCCSASIFCLITSGACKNRWGISSYSASPWMVGP